MRYFLVEGIVTHPEKMTSEMMAEHQAYTGRLMEEGKVLFSSLKRDMSRSVTVAKGESEDQIRRFYQGDPFSLSGVVTYSISELEVHYQAPGALDWFQG